MQEFGEFLNTGLNRFVYDNFLTTESLVSSLSGSSALQPKLFAVDLSTGIQQDSENMLSYDNNLFNPVYSQAYVRFTMPEITNCFAFIGFKQTLAAPTLDMTESHAGIIVSGGKIYWSTGGTKGTRTGYTNHSMTGLDLARDSIFLIENSKLMYYPLPVVVPYYDSFYVKSLGRVWSLKARNTSFTPEDRAHYFVVYIKNTTGNNKSLLLKNFTYLENYVD